MAYIEKECNNCKQIFKAELKEHKRGNAKFCTRSCSAKFHGALVHQSKIPNVSCALCEKPFYKSTHKKTLSRSGLYFCCRAHKDAAQRLGGIEDIMPDHYGTGTGENSYRRIALAQKPTQCERCGYNQHKAAIVIHHRDRNRSNNDISNLEVLCANCHAIEHHGD